MIKCKRKAQCDYCDARCPDWYEETDEYISWYQLVKTPSGSDYAKVTKYKKPRFNKDNEQIKEIEIKDTKEEH